MASVSVGDLQNNLRKLEKVLRAVHYGGEIDFAGLARGAVSAYIPIYEYLFTSYHRAFSERLCSDGVELSGKVDYAFVKAVYKVLRDMFTYKPPITVDQFFRDGFVERKAIMAVDIIDIVRKHYAPRPAAQRSSVQSKGLQSMADVKRSAKDTTSCARGSNSGLARAIWRPFDDHSQMPPARRGLVPSTVLLGAGNGPSDEASMFRNSAGRLQPASRGDSWLQENPDTGVPANFSRVQREHTPVVYRGPAADASDADRQALLDPDGFAGDYPRDPATRLPSRRPLATMATATTHMVADQQATSSRTAEAVHYGSLTQVATALAKSMESVNRRLKAMEERLDELASGVTSGSGCCMRPEAAAPSEAPAPPPPLESGENLEARIVLLESRLASLSATVSRSLAAAAAAAESSVAGSHTARPVEPSAQTAASAVAATAGLRPAEVVRGGGVAELPPVGLSRVLTAEVDGSSSRASAASGSSHASSSSSSSSSVGARAGGRGHWSLVSGVGGDHGSAGLLVEPSFAGNDIASAGDRLSAANSASEPCCLTTPDRAKVNKISQMLEGTMKMLRAK